MGNVRKIHSVSGGQEVRRAADAARAETAAHQFDVLGKAIALHVGRVMADAPWLPACRTCVGASKRYEREHGLAVGIARQASEPIPDYAPPQVMQAVTWDDSGPKCLAHYEDAAEAGDGQA